MQIKAYQKYKDSGVEWLGKVPDHWDVRKLRYLFNINKNIAGQEGYDVLSITRQGIKIKDIESNEGQLSSDYSKYQIVDIGDFAMNHMDLLTGYVDISLYRGVTSPDYRVFSIKNNLTSDSKYNLYLLQLCYQHKLFYHLGQGVSGFGRWRLPREEFNNFNFPLPLLDEQKAIASFLDRETAKIDSLIAKKEKQIELLEEKRAALIHEAIQNDATKDLRIGYIADQIKRPINRKNDEIYTPIGLYNYGRGIFHKEATSGSELGDSDFFWIESNDLVLSGQFAWEGAVALARDDDAGCIVSHRYPVLRAKPNLMETAYLFAFFTTKTGDFLLNEHSRGAAGRNRPLNAGTLLKENIPVPPIAAQHKVSELVYFERKFRKIVAASIDLLREYRTALISAAVTGKIDVRDGA
ncbi:restriction endonuclease subunit S [bacterium]|nr:restriction endonuclease subunit S [bacterium]